MKIKQKMAVVLSFAMLASNANIIPLSASDNTSDGNTTTPATGTTRLKLKIIADNKGDSERPSATGSTRLSLSIDLTSARADAKAGLSTEAGEEPADNVAAAIEEASNAIDAATTADAVAEAKEAGITAIRAAKALNADKAAFDTKKTEGKTAAAGRVTASDSEAVRNLSAEAVTAIGALTYDTTLTAAGKTTLELNKKRVDDILSELDTAIENQKALEAAEALAAAKEDAKAAVKAAGGETPSEAVSALVTAGNTAIDEAETTDAVTAAKDNAISGIREQIAAENIPSVPETPTSPEPDVPSVPETPT